MMDDPNEATEESGSLFKADDVLPRRQGHEVVQFRRENLPSDGGAGPLIVPVEVLPEVRRLAAFRGLPRFLSVHAIPPGCLSLLLVDPSIRDDVA